jgi:peptide-methionine (S)-S-oxide reductase
VFEYLEGVQEAISGYSGGEARLANYTAVSRGLTQHAEAVYVTYDADVISYQELLDVFFKVAHNPTQLNYQGPDHGTQYRSEIFFTNSDQRDQAQQAIDQLEIDKTYNDPIVTKLSALEAFYPAEEYHQDFMQKNPRQGYVVYWDWPKIEHLEQDFPQLFLDAKWR